jgi:hypothetical protein
LPTFFVILGNFPLGTLSSMASTYCRLSWHTPQGAGGWSSPSYCVPQVVRMKFGMAHHPLGSPHTPGVTSSTEFPAGSRK